MFISISFSHGSPILLLAILFPVADLAVGARYHIVVIVYYSNKNCQNLRYHRLLPVSSTVSRRTKRPSSITLCYVYSLPLCYFTQSALPKYQTGCCSVLHALLCPAKRIKQARCLCSLN